MRIFDPHIHMSARTTNDYAAMYLAGVRAVVEPAFWLGQPRTNVGSFVDYFDGLIGWERFRAAQYGIRHHATIGLNPKEANDPRCREVLEVLPRYLAKDGVVAVGELGYDSMTAAEDEVFVAQLALAREFELPAMVHTPHRDKAAGTLRTLDVIRDAGIAPGMVVVDHLNETTVAAVADSGCWMGFSIYPDTKMDEARMVAILREHGTERMLVNSAADWGNSDPLKTRKTGQAMLDAGFTEADVDVVLWQNPVAFYGQSGRLHLDPVPGFDEATDASGAADASNAAIVPAAGATFEGNSVLRGARV